MTTGKTLIYTASVHQAEAKRIKAAALKMEQAKLFQVASDYRHKARAHQLAAQRMQRLATASNPSNVQATP